MIAFADNDPVYLPRTRFIFAMPRDGERRGQQEWETNNAEKESRTTTLIFITRTRLALMCSEREMQGCMQRIMLRSHGGQRDAYAFIHQGLISPPFYA